jgi:hypothetical protein
MEEFIVATTEEERTTLDGALIDAFKAALHGEVFCPGDAVYDEARLIWNGMFDKKPALIAQCSGTADVIDAVNFARDNGLLTAVRSGGHNSSGSGSCDGGILIDLSGMNAVHVDPKTRRARVQGGATWGDFDCEAQLHGLAAPGGVVSATGVGGLTLAGGLGWLRGKYGLSAASMASASTIWSRSTSSPPTACCATPARARTATFSGACAAAAATSASSPRSSSRSIPSGRR